ncbi:MAG: PASTA domain-containing protein [Bacteroidota bacterium]
MRTKVGIFFGGPSREREISFAGGRTVYDNLNKVLFEPVPIFVDSAKKWYLLDWQYLYKGSIRDFFPPVEMIPDRDSSIQIYQESLGPMAQEVYEQMGQSVGRMIRRSELPELIDVAFLALHGEYGEDGQIQRELEYLGIPYTGSGVQASEIGMDKSVQKTLMQEKGFAAPAIEVISRTEYFGAEPAFLYERSGLKIGWPMVVRPANQGSSIGVSILQEADGPEEFKRLVEAAFFHVTLPISEWAGRDAYEQAEYLRYLSDLRDGLAYPLDAKLEGEQHAVTIYTPEDLASRLNSWAKSDPEGILHMQGHQSEDRVLLEAFIEGREFSCIVLRTEDGGCVALPPTEIRKGAEVYDYRSKYLPGLSRKITPIDLPESAISAIRKDCEKLFTEFSFGAYARIDGFYQEDGTIYLNDPNTTSGMMPSSFFFHQAAEIGLGPSELLTYIIRISLWEREQQGSDLGENAAQLAVRIDEGLSELKATLSDQQTVAVMLGGYNAERHISVESGRNVYEKLSGGGRYKPFPVFLSRDANTGGNSLHVLPLNLLLKDNADDIKIKLDAAWVDHPSVLEVRRSCGSLIQKYATDPRFAPEQIDWNTLVDRADMVFIALHGRPGEDGEVQTKLEALGLPYNGSEPVSSRLTIDKYETLSRLRAIGMPTAAQLVISEGEFLQNEGFCYDRIEAELDYPLVAKPVDDGCSAAVKLIRQRDELYAYCHLMFRTPQLDEAHARRELRLKKQEEFPQHPRILFEQFVEQGDAIHFLEITGGLITRYDNEDELTYEIFEPSETPAGATILSLEEKFLAGEGQNITPARLAVGAYDYAYVSTRVKADLERAARELKVSGYCRIDAFVRVYEGGRVETIIIEINSLPGMTPATAIFHQAAVQGYTPHDFIDQLLQFGLERQSRNSLAVMAQSVSEIAADIKNSPSGVSFTTAEAQAAAATLAMESTPPTPEPELEENHFDAPEHKDGETPRWKQILTSTKEFITSKYFWRNFGVLIGMLLIGFFILKGGLRCYTKHGQSMELPNFEGLHISEARELANSRGLTLRVLEANFDKDREPGLVVLQEPPEGSRIKRQRSIYLTVLSDTPAMVTLPSLVGNYDYDVYTRKLESLDIEFEVVEEEYDPRQEEKTILHFFYDGRKITDEDLRRGVQVPQGTRLGFVITKRRTGQVTMPDVVCQTYNESAFVIAGSQLLIGDVEGSFSNRESAYVVRTEPSAGQSVAEGRRVKLVLSDYRPSGCQ